MRRLGRRCAAACAAKPLHCLLGTDWAVATGGRSRCGQPPLPRHHRRSALAQSRSTMGGRLGDRCPRGGQPLLLPLLAPRLPHRPCLGMHDCSLAAWHCWKMVKVRQGVRPWCRVALPVLASLQWAAMSLQLCSEAVRNPVPHLGCCRSAHGCRTGAADAAGQHLLGPTHCLHYARPRESECPLLAAWARPHHHPSRWCLTASPLHHPRRRRRPPPPRPLPYHRPYEPPPCHELPSTPPPPARRPLHRPLCPSHEPCPRHRFACLPWHRRSGGQRSLLRSLAPVRHVAQACPRTAQQPPVLPSRSRPRARHPSLPPRLQPLLTRQSSPCLSSAGRWFPVASAACGNPRLVAQGRAIARHRRSCRCSPTARSAPKSSWLAAWSSASASRGLRRCTRQSRAERHFRPGSEAPQ